MTAQQVQRGFLGGARIAAAVVALAAAGTACIDPGPDSPDDRTSTVAQNDLSAIAGYQIVIYMYNGVQLYMAGTVDAVIVGTGFPPGQAIIWAGASESTVASAIATVTAEPGTVATVSILGTETTVVGGGAGGVAGGTVLGTLGTTAAIGAAAVAIAVGTVVAIDCATHDECIWTAVNNAGGWRVVIGTGPNPASAPNAGWVTVSCNPTAGDLTTQCRGALGNVITQYYSWFGGSYWTCGQMWASSGSSALWNQELAACNAQVQGCVTQTVNVCTSQGLAFQQAPAGGGGGCGGGGNTAWHTPGTNAVHCL